MKQMKVTRELERGQIAMVDFGEFNGSVQGGLRPCIIISNNLANRHSGVIICVPMTSNTQKRAIPTHALIEPCDKDNCLKRASVALCEQITTIAKDSIKCITGKLSSHDCERVDKCIKVSLSL